MGSMLYLLQKLSVERRGRELQEDGFMVKATEC